MRISPVNNCQIKSNKIFSLNQKNNTTEEISFKSKNIYLKGNISDINNNKFPDELYLNLDKVYKTFEDERSYQRWENFPKMLGDVLAKRCDYLELTKNAEYAGHGKNTKVYQGYPGTHYIDICESDKDENAISLELDWTKEYNELEAFFDGVPGRSFGAEYDMNQIRKGLPEILKKQGWIK